MSKDELKELRDKLKDANEALLEKDQQLKDAMTANEGLQEKLEELEQQLEATAKAGKPIAPVPQPKPQIPTKSFKVEKEEYLFTVPAFHLDGKRVLASEALTNPDLLKHLVEIGFGGIKRKGA